MNRLDTAEENISEPEYIAIETFQNKTVYHVYSYLL